MHKNLQDEQKCLENVPCSDVFASIGIGFKFEYEEDGDANIERVKELTSRYAIKKLLDIASDIDDQ